MLLFSIILAATLTKCQIEGVISSSNFLPSQELSCVKTKNCPPNTPTTSPEGYNVFVKITSVGDLNCEKLYKKDTIMSFFVNKSIYKSGDNFAKDKVISGQTTTTNTATFESYKIAGSQTDAKANTQSLAETKIKTDQNWFEKIIAQIILWLRGIFKK